MGYINYDDIIKHTRWLDDNTTITVKDMKDILKINMCDCPICTVHADSVCYGCAHCKYDFYDDPYCEKESQNFKLSEGCFRYKGTEADE